MFKKFVSWTSAYIVGLFLLSSFTFAAYSYYVFGYINESPMPIWEMTILLGYGYVAWKCSIFVANQVEDFIYTKILYL